MVNTRMEGRVESVEREIGAAREDVRLVKGDVHSVKEDVNTLKEWFLEIKDSIARLERKGAATRDEEHRTEGSCSHDGGNRERENGKITERETGRFRKLELLVFDGEDVIGWLFRVERYFTLNRVKEAEKLEAVAVCLEGRALNWLQWFEARYPLQDWADLKRELLKRFHHSQHGNEYEMLMALKQEGTVAEFRENFELLSAPLKDAPEEMFIGTYQNGLKEEIRAELRMLKAYTLMEVMDLSTKVEERNLVLGHQKEEKVNRTSTAFSDPKWAGNTSRPNSLLVSSGSNSSSVNTLSSTRTAAPDTFMNANRNSFSRGSNERVSTSPSSINKEGFRHLTDAEYNRKRELGLCFKCDEKFGPNHKCKMKQLSVLLLSAAEEEEEEEGKVNSEEAEIEMQFPP